MVSIEQIVLLSFSASSVILDSSEAIESLSDIMQYMSDILALRWDSGILALRWDSGTRAKRVFMIHYCLQRSKVSRDHLQLVEAPVVKPTSQSGSSTWV